jgi:hypothetical protein
MSDPTRSEVLKEFGELIAAMRERMEKKRSEGQQLSKETEHKIDCLTVGYLYIQKHWAP